MLPLGNRPVVDYIVADCVKAGIRDIYFVVSGDAAQLRSYYARDQRLEDYLSAQGKAGVVPSITPPADVTFHFIEQDMSDGRYGTTIPVLACRQFVDAHELFLVVMGDDVTHVRQGESDIERLVALGRPAILGVPIADSEDISRYGVIEQRDGGIFSRIVEKPAPGTEPSRMINVSKYVLPGAFMGYAQRSAEAGPAVSGEYPITDPINELVQDGVELQVLEARGEFLDVGTVATWLAANNWLLRAPEV